MFKNIFCWVLFLSLSFSQNIWGNGSVSTSDDLSAFEFNPAGFGVNHGRLDGFYMQPDSDGKFTKDSKIYAARIRNGFGLSYAIDNNIVLSKFNTFADFKIGYGAKIHNNAYFGLSLDKDRNGTLGCLYRPYKWLSLGITDSFNDFFTDHNETRFGVAVRPFSNHHFTIGFDHSGSNTDELNPFIEIYPIDGLKVSISNQKLNNQDNLSITLGFEFEANSGLYVSNTKNSDTDSNFSGIGFISSERSKPALLDQSIDKRSFTIVKLNLEGTFIEEPPKVSPFNFDFISSIGPIQFGSDNNPGIQLRTFIAEIDRFANDESVDAMSIKLGSIICGFSKRQEIRNALMRFKNAGKKIYVYSDGQITNSSYYLISMADEIYMHEQNSVYLNGFSPNLVFYKGLLDKMDITPVVYRVQKDGKSYKGAMDSFLNNEISKETEEEYNKIFDDLYYVFVRDISEGRGWSMQETEKAINNGPYLIAQHAADAGLITKTMYPDQYKDHIEGLSKKVNFINFKKSKSPEYNYSWKKDKKPNIAVIYAVGGIMPGESNPGPQGSSVMGDKTIIKAFKDAYEDKNIDAIILRIDSGGGSALASDMMWRQMIKSKKDSKNKKPFIVSMSDVAASGGYYIATEADKIVANETTITGSIGVISFWPNFSKLMNKYGINFDNSIKRGDHSDFKYISIANRLHNDYEKEKIQEALNDVYDKFKVRVIDGRKDLNDIDELDNIALGRIWTGSGAKNVFLVDEVGGFYKAIETTKEMLELSEESEVSIEEYPKIYDNNFSVFEAFSETEKKIDISSDLIPDEIMNQVEILDMLPILYSDDMLMILPYQIEVD